MALAYLYLHALFREEEDKRFRLSKRRRMLRERFVLNSIPDKEFVYKYRLSRELFDRLCEELKPLLPPKQRKNGLDLNIKILAVLNYFAWGRIQHSTGRNFNMLLAPQTLSRCIKEVTAALTHSSIVRKYIRFPQNKDERAIIKKKFYEKFGIPDVIGCIDCTHVAIIRPTEKDHLYLNEQNYYSFFTQLICDADCNIIGLDASYGGRSHNSDIWLAHPIDDHLNQLQEQETAYLLGDTNYSVVDHLLTPIVDDVKENSPESRYNEIHKAAHSTITKTITMLKARWRYLLTVKELHYNHEMAAKIMIACAVLHNMCNMAGIQAPALSERDIAEEKKRQNEPWYCDDISEEARKRVVQELEEIRRERSL